MHHIVGRWTHLVGHTLWLFDRAILFFSHGLAFKKADVAAVRGAMACAQWAQDLVPNRRKIAMRSWNE
jgi:hypothetical protein